LQRTFRLLVGKKENHIAQSTWFRRKDCQQGPPLEIQRSIPQAFIEGPKKGKPLDYTRTHLNTHYRVGAKSVGFLQWNKMKLKPWPGCMTLLN
jgi:hypothetical protein